jgi:hypothetical protein
MATLHKVLINRADYQIGGGVALRLRTQGVLKPRHFLGVREPAGKYFCHTGKRHPQMQNAQAGSGFRFSVVPWGIEIV